MSDLVHPRALCETERVGPGTRVLAFAHVREGAVLGRDVVIGDHAHVASDVVVGDRVVVGAGAQLWDGVRVEDDVLIGPQATLVSGQPSPAQGGRGGPGSHTIVCRGARVGANATILPGMTIGQDAVVGAGAVVTRSVPPHAVVTGNPARIRGYSGSRPPGATDAAPEPAAAEGSFPSRVRGVVLHRLPLRRDLRGSLTVAEFPGELPFAPKRWFAVFDVPGSEIRGEHAHRRCHLFLVCVRGACSVVVDDAERREEFRLDHPTLGLHLPPMVWGTQYKHTGDAVLLVFASEPYDPDDYIRDYQAFLDEARRSRS
jgi:acetyltransferase-like isoleucine patch superfamily enzyme